MSKLVFSEFGRVVVVLIIALGGLWLRPEASAQDVSAQIARIWDEYSLSLSSGNIDDWIGLWAEDGIQMPPGSPPAVGREAIRAKMKSILDRVSFDISITNEEVAVAGEWAFSRGVYKATLTPKDGSKPSLIDGKYMTILRKQPDESWKIYRDIFNSNAP
jgi:uncharacterized protein (TIGR02246 family)